MLLHYAPTDTTTMCGVPTTPYRWCTGDLDVIAYQLASNAGPVCPLCIACMRRYVRFNDWFAALRAAGWTPPQPQK